MRNVQPRTSNNSGVNRLLKRRPTTSNAFIARSVGDVDCPSLRGSIQY